jgi:hypothetical protein
MKQNKNQDASERPLDLIVMRPEEAILFLRKHSAWLEESWSRSPEGREYKKRFDAAISALVPYNDKLTGDPTGTSKRSGVE